MTYTTAEKTHRELVAYARKRGVRLTLTVHTPRPNTWAILWIWRTTGRKGNGAHVVRAILAKAREHDATVILKTKRELVGYYLELGFKHSGPADYEMQRMERRPSSFV